MITDDNFHKDHIDKRGDDSLVSSITMLEVDDVGRIEHWGSGLGCCGSN